MQYAFFIIKQLRELRFFCILCAMTTYVTPPAPPKPGRSGKPASRYFNRERIWSKGREYLYSSTGIAFQIKEKWIILYKAYIKAIPKRISYHIRNHTIYMLKMSTVYLYWIALHIIIAYVFSYTITLTCWLKSVHPCKRHWTYARRDRRKQNHNSPHQILLV